MPRADALARERFGDVDGVVAELYHIDGSRERRRQRADWLGDFMQDVKFAARSLRRRVWSAVPAGSAHAESPEAPVLSLESDSGMRGLVSGFRATNNNVRTIPR